MPPIHMLIKPASSLCNMRCRYCFYADVSQQREVPSYGVMSEETLRVLVQKTLAFAQGECTFAFQGGEPTLAGLDFYRTLITLQKTYNVHKVRIHNAIQTNGLVVDSEWAQFFHKNGFLVGLSLDGDAQIHNAVRPDQMDKGTHARVSRAADLLAKYGCEYNILCVVTQPVARHGGRVYNHLKRHRFLQFIPCLDGFDGSRTELSLTPEAYGRFLQTTFDLYYDDLMRGNYISVRTFDNYVRMLAGYPPENCAMQGICTCNPVVEGDGSIYPCDFYVVDTWRLGNIHDDDLPKMLHGGRIAQFVEPSRTRDERCDDCEWLFLCRGGCRREREATLGAPLSRNRFCDAYRSFFAYATDRMRTIARNLRR